VGQGWPDSLGLTMQSRAFIWETFASLATLFCGAPCFSFAPLCMPSLNVLFSKLLHEGPNLSARLRRIIYKKPSPRPKINLTLIEKTLTFILSSCPGALTTGAAMTDNDSLLARCALGRLSHLVP
jgi:hypothetical protein